MLLTGNMWSRSVSQQWGWGQSPALLITAGHCSFPSHVWKDKPEQISSWVSRDLVATGNPPASQLMVNAYSVARPWSFCAQMLPVSNAIGRLSLIGSNLMFPAFLRFHTQLQWQGAQFECSGGCTRAGEAQPSGSLLSGGSGEQQSKRPERYSSPEAPCSHRGSAAAHPARHPSVADRCQGKSKEDWSRGRRANRSSEPPAPCLLGSQLKEERESYKKNPTPATYPCLLLQPAYMELKSDQTSQTTQICDETW